MVFGGIGQVVVVVQVIIIVIMCRCSYIIQRHSSSLPILLQLLQLLCIGKFVIVVVIDISRTC